MSNGLFYPNAKWVTYRNFPRDSVLNVLGILNCDLPKFESDTFHKKEILPDGKIVFIEEITNPSIPKPSAMCFAPGFGIILWSKGEFFQ